MSSEQYPVRQLGIYRNLPSFDPAIKGLTAMITGANGISGFHTMRALLDSPERWNKILAVSRRPPPEEMMALLTPDQRSRVHHIACDFLEPPTKIAEALQSADSRPSHVFFYSYIHKEWSQANELLKTNKALFANFLEGLALAKIQPRRILLQTGGKNYGMHIGRVRTPLIESGPQPRHLLPNFYYAQEDLLHEYCQKNNIGWNVIRPAAVIGAVSNAGMNTFHPFAIYAAVQARKREPIAFGGDWEQWQYEYYHCSARMTGYLSEWAALEDKCRNQAFNSQDGGPLSWDRFFSELARWFDVDQGVVPPPEDESQLKLHVGKPGKESPLGYGPPLSSRSSFTLADWARDTRNQEVWEGILKTSDGMTGNNPFDEGASVFPGAELAFMRFGSVTLNKARRFGWTGFVDTMESIYEMYKDMEALGMLPTMAVDTPLALY